jgi:hypothetical protein
MAQQVVSSDGEAASQFAPFLSNRLGNRGLIACIYQAGLLLLLTGLPKEHDFLPPMEGTVMNTSEIRTRIEGSEKSSLVTRIAELDETPVLTLVDTAERNEAESSEMPDPLIQALVQKLPKANNILSLEDRAKWLRAAAIIFNLVYKPGEVDSKTEDMPIDLKSAG